MSHEEVPGSKLTSPLNLRISNSSVIFIFIINLWLGVNNKLAEIPPEDLLKEKNNVFESG